MIVGAMLLGGAYLNDKEREQKIEECRAKGGVPIEARLPNGPKGQRRYDEPVCISKDAVK